MAESVAVDPGGSVALTWRSTGGVKATLLQQLPGKLLGESLLVPPTGSTLVEIGAHERYWHTFDLVVSNDTDQTDQRLIIVQILCPYDYFFTPAPINSYGTTSCPFRPAASSWAAEQVFEGGRLIWLQGIPAESTGSGRPQGPTIYVLYSSTEQGDGGWYEKYDDTWVSGEPESDPSISPPEGLFQPVRGFGKLWRDHPEVRERLGWALAPEQGFESAFQVDWRPYYLVSGTYIRSLDGGVITLGVMGTWER
jgi:hypothetical protein